MRTFRETVRRILGMPSKCISHEKPEDVLDGVVTAIKVPGIAIFGAGRGYAQATLKPSRALISGVVLGFAGLVGTVALSSGTLHAQNAYGSAVGTITDNSGAIIGGATVTLTDVDTGDTRTDTTNSAGDYQFVNLVPGNYRVDVQNTGFKRFTRINVVVEVGGSTRVDAALEVGNITQSVEVSSQPPLLETQQDTIGQVVMGRVVTEIPLNGRDVFNLLELSPGIVPQGSSTSGATTNAAALGSGGLGTGNYQISGGIPGTEAYFLDGAPLNTGYVNAIAYVPAQDSIQEFRAEANNVGPEFGGTMDGVVTMVTKSGTNALHGTAYDFLRNTILNGNTFFSNRAHLTRPAFIQNQYGATLGGPIKKDKFFFFGSFEGVRAAVGTTTTYTVPTPAELTGNLSNYTAPITDPGQFNASGVFVPNATPTTFSGNIIPASRIDHTAEAMSSWWALPNGPGTSNNYTVNTTTHPIMDQYIARLDWTASEKQRVFGRYTYHRYVAVGALPYGYMDNPSLSKNAVQQFVLGDDYTFNPTTILDLRLSYFRGSSFSGNTCVPCNIAFTGWPAATIAQMNSPGPVIPYITVSGFSAQGGGGQTIPATTENYALSGNVTKILGRHTFRTGAEIRRAPANYGQTNSTKNEAFGFTSAFTGNALASYLLGLPQSELTENLLFPATNEYYAGIYFGDTYQVTNKLAVNLGVRWEYPGYWTERHNRLGVFLSNQPSPLAGPTGLPLTGNVVLVNTPAYPYRTVKVPQYDLFSPRLGVVYQANKNTVVRSGFGLLYAPGNTEQDVEPYDNPVNLVYTQVSPTTEPINALSNPFPQGVLPAVGRSANYQSVIQGQTVIVPSPKEPSAYVEQWNLDLQQDLGQGILLDIAYVGDRGVHQQSGNSTMGNGMSLNQIPDQYLSMGSALLNPVPNPFHGLITFGPLSGATIPAGQLLRPYPQYFGLYNPADAKLGSTYNALQAKLEKRFNQGGTLLAAYTWASNRGNADEKIGFEEASAPGQIQDWTNLHAELSQMSFNIPQRFVLGYVLDLPVGKGKAFLGSASGVVDKAVSGWGIDGISTFQSGWPLILTAQPTYISSNFGAGVPRPNVVAGCSKQISGGAYSRLSGWFDKSCFTQPGQFAFGNEPRVDPTLRTQGQANWDFAAFKGTAINERFNLQFRAEFFNVFNRVQFGYANTTCCSNTNSTFGVVSSQLNAPRQIQFALRLIY